MFPQFHVTRGNGHENTKIAVSGKGNQSNKQKVRTSPRKATKATDREAARWLAILNGFTELEQTNPTRIGIRHVDGESESGTILTASRIDHVYCSYPSWLLMHLKPQIHG